METKNYCEPIKTFEEAMQYSSIQYHNAKYHKFTNKYSCVNEKYDCHVYGNKELNPRTSYSVNNVPKTLVCHDMKGGYLHDK